MYQGHYTEVKLPDQLFISKLGSNLNYTSSNWINQNSINIMTQIRNKTSNSGDNLFIKAFGDKGCVISITSTDSFWQSSEVLVNIEVQKWASKIWIECDGPYESNWLKWATNFVLSDSKAWLIASSYPLFSSSSIFQIWGFISFAIILLHIVLSVRYGSPMLELVIHTQAVMLMMLSSTNSESKLIEYFSWLQYFKFDFGFIYEIIKLKKFNCTNSTDKLALLNLFCNETLINYLNLFFIIAFLIMYRLLSKHSFLSIKAISNLFSKWILWQSSSMYWTFILASYNSSV